MANSVKIRLAKRTDAAELAILVDISSHGFASYIWKDAVSSQADTILEQGRLAMSSDDTGGWKDAIIAEDENEIAGAAIGYGLPQNIQNTNANIFLEPLLKLQQRYPESWYIDSIAVYRHRRGAGIAGLLMDDQIQRAEGRSISVITESYNVAAQTLYFSKGFTETSRLKAVPLPGCNDKHDWVLLTRIAE